MKDFLANWWFLLTMLGIATVLSFVYLFVWNRKTLKAKWWELLIISVLHTVFGLLCVRFWVLLEAGFDAEKAGNMSLFGGVFLMPVFYAVYAIVKKIPFRDVFDVFVIPLTGTLFLARCNCLHGGCCQGIMTSGGWRIPTREIELAFYAVLIICMSTWVVKRQSKGLACPVYMATYGLFRFVLEWMREGEGTFRMGHIWGIVSLVIGTILIVLVATQNKKKQIQIQ